MEPSIIAPDRNNAARPKASGPNSLDVMGEASTVIKSAIVAPPVKIKTLSAKVAVPLMTAVGWGAHCLRSHSAWFFSMHWQLKIS